jgi:hypothetical protein
MYHFHLQIQMNKPSKKPAEAAGKLSCCWFLTWKMEVICPSETWGYL